MLRKKYGKRSNLKVHLVSGGVVSRKKTRKETGILAVPSPYNHQSLTKPNDPMLDFIKSYKEKFILK